MSTDGDPPIDGRYGYGPSLDGPPAPYRSVPPTPARRNPWPYVVGGVAVVAAAIVFALVNEDDTSVTQAPATQSLTQQTVPRDVPPATP